MSATTVLLLAEIAFGMALLRWLLASAPLPGSALDPAPEATETPPGLGPFR